MEIEKIDKNLKMETQEVEGGQLYKIPCAPFHLHGIFYSDEHGFLRMPKEVADSVSEGVGYLNAHTAGGRLIFSTDSTSLTIHVQWKSFDRMINMTIIGQAGFTLCERTEDGEVWVANLSPTLSVDNEKGFDFSIKLKGNTLRNYVLYFPLYNRVQSLSVELDKNAIVKEGKGYRPIKPILYYGSSITQGASASRPDNSYQAIISDRLNVDYICLGFAGCAKGEEQIVDYLTTVDCSIFVCDYDHNALTADFLSDTHKRLYERYRAVRPQTPIIFVSRADDKCFPNGDERAEIIKATYKNAQLNGDNNVWFIDGREIYPKYIREHCTVDDCHPTDLGFYFMSEKIGNVIEKIINERKIVD